MRIFFDKYSCLNRIFSSRGQLNLEGNVKKWYGRTGGILSWKTRRPLIFCSCGTLVILWFCLSCGQFWKSLTRYKTIRKVVDTPHDPHGMNTSQKPLSIHKFWPIYSKIAPDGYHITNWWQNREILNTSPFSACLDKSIARSVCPEDDSLSIFIASRRRPFQWIWVLKSAVWVSIHKSRGHEFLRRAVWEKNLLQDENRTPLGDGGEMVSI